VEWGSDRVLDIGEVLCDPLEAGMEMVVEELHDLMVGWMAERGEGQQQLLQVVQ